MYHNFNYNKLFIQSMASHNNFYTQIKVLPLSYETYNFFTIYLELNEINFRDIMNFLNLLNYSTLLLDSKLLNSANFGTNNVRDSIFP